ncbi:MAG: hypothetical protein C0505_08300 [Leptothrix sp. (in: Bacteria)]|nr:hypothetical protein [Leptothrix sp. (in: b-proteobacteria)]
MQPAGRPSAHPIQVRRRPGRRVRSYYLPDGVGRTRERRRPARAGAPGIAEISAVLNGTRTVLSTKSSVSVSRGPLPWFCFADGKAGDKLAVTWKDNTGDS